MLIFFESPSLISLGLSAIDGNKKYIQDIREYAKLSGSKPIYYMPPTSEPAK
jgi:hypothetical protein